MRAGLAAAVLVGWMLPLAADPSPDRLERLQAVYEGRDDWCLRAFALLGIAAEEDDRVVGLLEPGLGDKHDLVRGVAALALRDLTDEVLRAGANAAYVERLLGTYLVSRKSPREVEMAYAHLKRLAKDDFGRNLARWKKWWVEAKPSWSPPPVGRIAPPQDGEGGGRTMALLDRILDLQTDGLDLVLAIDSTGSMQPYIDAAKERLEEMIAVLAAIIPAEKLRMGLVTYEDTAQVREELAAKPENVRKKLDRLVASGGGDWEEGVDRALEEALESRKMNWRREAAKIVLVCGDAPAHAADRLEMYGLVERMHQAPERLEKIVLTGKGARVKPFLVSCVHVMLEGGGRVDAAELKARELTAECFQTIAKKGGGTYVVASEADEVIVQLLVLSFGVEWREEIERFLRCFRELRNGGK